ncbi:MAG: alpha/beta hydrolase [Nitrospirae bacterium]|nr:alpha/beta hydrolase [Nitrospirota bacterium]
MIRIIKHSIRSLPVYGLIAALLAWVFSPGCYSATKVPIDTVHYDAGDVKGPRLLFVFLHGNGDRNSVFDKEGFVTAVRARGLPVDMISVDAHIGYYINGTILTRLKEDVIDPARARGYERIWLIGNSLGGSGSLSYVREYPNEITGVVLLGPFLGERPLIEEIRHAGGLLRWEPGDVILKTREDAEKHVWIWLKEHGQQGQSRAGDKDCPKKQGCVPKIYLGYGTNDRFTYAQDLLASLLPPEQVIAIDGGHGWSTWKKLWDRFLDQNIFGP